MIVAIDAAAAEQAEPKKMEKDQLAKAKASAAQCRKELDAALAREIALIWEVFELKKKRAHLTDEKLKKRVGLNS